MTADEFIKETVCYTDGLLHQGIPMRITQYASLGISISSYDLVYKDWFMVSFYCEHSINTEYLKLLINNLLDRGALISILPKYGPNHILTDGTTEFMFRGDRDEAVLKALEYSLRIV